MHWIAQLDTGIGAGEASGPFIGTLLGEAIC